MENEVMQFQTIILMLMRIERVNVEMILEWLERYSNIFREPIAKCVNNYESGPWEALEEMKDDVNYKEFIRLIESMQAKQLKKFLLQRHLMSWILKEITTRKEEKSQMQD